MKNRIYLVTSKKGEEFLVDTTSQSRAISRVTQPLYDCRVATQRDLIARRGLEILTTEEEAPAPKAAVVDLLVEDDQPSAVDFDNLPEVAQG